MDLCVCVCAYVYVCVCVHMCLSTHVHIPGGQSLQSFANAVSAIITKSQKLLAPARKKEGKSTVTVKVSRGRGDWQSLPPVRARALPPTLGRWVLSKVHHLSPALLSLWLVTHLVEHLAARRSRRIW